jgi:hypothetical protein
MTLMLTRTVLISLSLLALVSLPSTAQPARSRTPAVTAMQVYRSPTCGCCGLWVDHVKAAGFDPVVHQMDDVSPVKARGGVPADLQSCHTALIGGYVIEGHVPADIVQRLLTEKPNIAGLAVPGMPVGSPGMEQGARVDPYQVIAFTKDGKRSVYAKRP